MVFEKVITERYSVRKFKDKIIEKKIIKKIINAVHLAPTGCNFQPQRILVLNTNESVEKLKKCTKCHFDPATMRETFHIPENIEPAALLVMGYPHQDAKPFEMHSKFRPIDEVVFYDSF